MLKGQQGGDGLQVAGEESGRDVLVLQPGQPGSAAPHPPCLGLHPQLSDDLHLTGLFRPRLTRRAVRVPALNLAHTVLRAGPAVCGVGREDDVLQSTALARPRPVLLLQLLPRAAILLLHVQFQHEILDPVTGVGEGESLMQPDLAERVKDPGHCLAGDGLTGRALH